MFRGVEDYSLWYSSIQCNDSVQDRGKISFITKDWPGQLLKHDLLRKQKTARTKVAISKSFCTMQIVIQSIMATKRKHRKRQSYIPGSFRIFISKQFMILEIVVWWMGNIIDRQKSYMYICIYNLCWGLYKAPSIRRI